MKKIILLTLTAGIVTLASPSVQASQSGSAHYVPGATASFIDALPGKPGFVAENVFMNYNDASAEGGRNLPFGNASLALDVNANVYADSILLMQTFEPEILGARYSVATAIPYVWASVKGKVSVNGGTGVSKSDYTTGLGDIEFWPFMLGWTNHDFKYDVRLGIYAPSGQYEAGQLANAGLGYWTFEPEVTFSWLSSKFGTEVSLFAGVDFNTMNTDADYQSGDIFHIDGTVAQHLPLLGGVVGVGANAFYLKQITGDSGSGAKLGSFEMQSIGIGPVASYICEIGKKTLAIEAKWLPQTQVENTTKGSFIWVKAALIF